MRRFWVRVEGQSLVLFALFLTVLLGMMALAIDVGYLYYARTSFQRAADAGCLAGGSGLIISRAQATSRAVEFAGYNLSGNLAGATTTVSFPGADLLRVDVNHPAVPLFFAPVIGWPTAPVSARAACITGPAASVSGAVPLAILCNSTPGSSKTKPGKGGGGSGAGQSNCNGRLAVGQTFVLRWRYCGNFYENGPNGSACGNIIGSDEIFLMGLYFDAPVQSNDVFRDEVYNGMDRIVSIGDVVPALEGNRGGWRDGMERRLDEQRGEFTVFGVKRAPSDPRQVEIVDFIRVRVRNFVRYGNTDKTTFEIMEVASTGSIRSAPDRSDYNFDSAFAIQLIE